MPFAVPIPTFGTSFKSDAAGARARCSILPDLGAHLGRDRLRPDPRGIVLVAAGLGYDFTARVAEVALAVELPDVPGMLVPYPIDGADKIAVRNGVRGLLQLP